MPEQQKYLPDGFGWLVLGMRIYRCLKEGRYATAAHYAKKGLALGVYEDAGSWRTAALLNYKIGEDI